MTTDQIVADVLRRELPPKTAWPASKALLHAADKGGWTRGGITAASWGRFAGLARPATPDELNQVTEAQAVDFYRHRHAEPFADAWQPLQVLLVDFGVTSSHAAVWKAAQAALKGLGLYAGAVDGVPGPATWAAIAAADRRALYLAVLDQRRRFYQSLAYDHLTRVFLTEHPQTQLHFARGWDNRAWEFVADVPDRTTT